MSKAEIFIATRSHATQNELRVCALPTCGQMFQPSRPSQRFHSDKCRMAYAKDYGHIARVVSVRVLKGGKKSVVMHMENTGDLAPGAEVQVVA